MTGTAACMVNCVEQPALAATCVLSVMWTLQPLALTLLLFPTNPSKDIKSRDDVLKMGIGAYNEECRSIVMRWGPGWGGGGGRGGGAHAGSLAEHVRHWRCAEGASGLAMCTGTCTVTSTGTYWGPGSGRSLGT